MIAEKIPIGEGSYMHRRDIVFSQAVTTLVTCVMFKLLQSLVNKLFVAQLVEVGFLCHWESLLSTIGGELGMLDDFIVAIHDLNNLKLKVYDCVWQGALQKGWGWLAENESVKFVFSVVLLIQKVKRDDEILTKPFPGYSC